MCHTKFFLRLDFRQERNLRKSYFLKTTMTFVTFNDLRGHLLSYKNVRLLNVNIHRNLYQNRFINECATNKKAKIP